jgi:hypothetical protein
MPAKAATIRPGRGTAARLVDPPGCLRGPRLLPNQLGRTSFVGRLGRPANTPARAWRAIRLPVCQRHPLGLQGSAEAICVLEPLPRNRRHRSWRAGRAGRLVLPRDRTYARRRHSRAGSRASDRAQRTGECEHDSPRFAVDREAMAGRAYRCTRGTVCRPGFLWKRAVRDVFHHLAAELCVGSGPSRRSLLTSIMDSPPCRRRPPPSPP